MIPAITGLILAFVFLMTAIYAVPIHRTWKIEHDEPLATPGPYADPHERMTP